MRKENKTFSAAQKMRRRNKNQLVKLHSGSCALVDDFAV
jgi:hypothetical protein